MTFNSYDDQGSEQVSRRRSFPLARVPAAAAALFLAVGVAACGGSSGGLPSAGTGSPAAAVSGFIGNIGSDVSSACGYVAPDQQSACNTAFTTAKITVASPGIGNTFTDGSQAIVVVLTSGACASQTGSTSTCASNSNPNEGLPSSDADFQTALTNAFNSNTETDIGCAEISGSWYVLLQPESSVPANTGATGAGTSSVPGPTGTTGTTTSGPTGTTGTTTSGPTGTTGTTTSGPTGTTGTTTSST